MVRRWAVVRLLAFGCLLLDFVTTSQAMAAGFPSSRIEMHAGRISRVNGCSDPRDFQDFHQQMKPIPAGRIENNTNGMKSFQRWGKCRDRRTMALREHEHAAKPGLVGA